MARTGTIARGIRAQRVVSSFGPWWFSPLSLAGLGEVGTPTAGRTR
jgi:hypothetical protein